LRERQDELDELGVGLIGVATREDYQAKKLIDDGLDVPLFLDPENAVRQTLGVARFSWWRLFHPKGAVAYVRAMRQIKRFGPVWAEANHRPAILLLDADLNLLWSSIGSYLGDYPSADAVLAQTRSHLGA
jgi:peroxiredoxin